MTAKKDLKRRVRERAAQTGESYVTARRNVLAQQGDGHVDAEPPDPTPAPAEEAKRTPISFEEMIDLTQAGRARGFRCVVTISSALQALVDPERVLDRVRTLLDLTTEDPDLERFRRVVLHGERITVPSVERADWYYNARRFLQRAKAGIGGVSLRGDMVAFVVGDQMVLAHIGNWPRFQTAASLNLTAIGTFGYGLEAVATVFVP
jgi:hypothetical protein